MSNKTADIGQHYVLEVSNSTLCHIECKSKNGFLFSLIDFFCASY